MWILLVSMAVVFVGCVMNFTVIVDNGGKMPVYDMYVGDIDKHFTYYDKEDIKWWYFSDIWGIGRMMFSVGDIFLVLGSISFITTSFFMFSKKWGIWTISMYNVVSISDQNMYS